MGSEDLQFFQEQESAACYSADCVVALSDADADALRALSGVECAALVPALRDELLEEAKAVVKANDQMQSHLIASEERVYLSCVCRLHTDKNVEAFVALIESMQGELKGSAVHPFLCGANGASDAYGDILRERLKACDCETIVHSGALPFEELAAVLRRTILVCHPALYEAYGLSIVEAAALGAPSLLNAQGVGAAASLRSYRDEYGEEVEADAFYTVDWTDADAVRQEVREVLGFGEREREEAGAMGMRARRAVLSLSGQAFVSELARTVGSAAGPSLVGADFRMPRTPTKPTPPQSKSPELTYEKRPGGRRHATSAAGTAWRSPPLSEQSSAERVTAGMSDEEALRLSMNKSMDLSAAGGGGAGEGARGGGGGGGGGSSILKAARAKGRTADI